MNSGRTRWTVGLCATGLLLSLCSGAWAETTTLDPELEYNVTVQIAQNEAKTLTAVHVLETTKIGGKDFLVVILPGYRARGFVALESVRSILPTKQGLSTGY